MDDLNDFEKSFFTYLQKKFSKNDFIKLNESYVPKSSSNRVNRFYSSDDSIWFARLSISDNKQLYYFGVMDDPTPKAIMTFNVDYSKSGIRFTKNQKVYVKVKLDSEIFHHVNKLFTLKYATNDKSSDYYYMDLGKINTSDLIENINILITRFIFNVSFKNKALVMKKYIEKPSFEKKEVKNNINYKDVLKLNMDIITVENNILKKHLQYSITNRLKEYLFSKNKNNDLILNPNFKNQFKLNEDEIFNSLNKTISSIDNSLSYEEIVEKIIDNLKKIQKDTKITKPDEEVKLSELEQMDIVLKAIKDNKTDAEAAKLANISEDKIFEWYEEGENSASKNTIYFFNKLNEILFPEMPIEDDDSQPPVEGPTVIETPDSIEDDDSQSPVEGPTITEYPPQGNGESKIYRFKSPLFNPGVDIYQEVKEKFPLETPRNDQLEIISEVAYAINNGYKYIILEAGTGTGKSAIAATLARIYENSYILTVTKQLQNQYYEDFKKYGFKLVKGRQNFKCIHHKNVTCDKGDCVLKNKSCDYNLTGSNPLQKLQSACKDYFWKSETHCPYWIQKADAVNSKVTIANYDFGLYDFNLSHYFKKRKLLILDEAHNLENKLMSFISLEFKRKTLKKDIGIDLDYNAIDKLQKGSVNDWIGFVRHVKEKYDERAKTLINRAKANGEDESFIKDLEKELKIESANRDRFIRYISNDKKNWICDYNDRQEIISFKPLSIKNYTHDYLFGFGDVCIFMSATILNHKKFAKWMGVDFKEVYSIRRDSPFNSSDNPIIVKDSFNMSRNYLRDSAPKTIPVLNEILSRHKNEKGLIHTVSGDCRRYIMRHINDDRLMTHTTKNRNKKLEEYKSSDNSVLVSPSMSEGVDLPGEQCRFQVIYKLPYMTLSEQVRQRLNEDEEWYDYRTSISLVQTFGRGIRFDGDYCTTYVVDSRFKDFIKNDKQKNHFIPDYVLKAIK